MENKVDLAHIERFADILLDEFEPRFVGKVNKIRAASGQEIIHDDHVPTLAEQGVTKMRSEETGSARDQSAFLSHAFLPFFRTAAGTPSGCDAARPTL
jgi:hypothetical protein